MDNLTELLDKRSELMKRGRVKRVFYETREEVTNLDRRGEFADLEKLEEEYEASRITSNNSCAQHQSGWIQR